MKPSTLKAKGLPDFAEAPQTKGRGLEGVPANPKALAWAVLMSRSQRDKIAEEKYYPPLL